MISRRLAAILVVAWLGSAAAAEEDDARGPSGRWLRRVDERYSNDHRRRGDWGDLGRGDVPRRKRRAPHLSPRNPSPRQPANRGAPAPARNDVTRNGGPARPANAVRVVSRHSLDDKILCGYQGWFAYRGDGAPIDKWRHWFRTPDDPSAEHLTVDMWPATDEYDAEDLMETNMRMRDGSPALAYSAVKPGVVRTHFEWMRDYGIAGVFHMRFMADLHLKKNHDWKTTVLRNVRDAAEATGRVFAVSYNIAGNNLDDAVLDDLKEDWMRLVDELGITGSGRYLHHGGLPVLRIYGIGFKKVNVEDAGRVLSLIKWLQHGAEHRYRVFLIGGVPSRWRDLVKESRTGPAWARVYASLDGIHPWTVGRWRTIDGFRRYYAGITREDAPWCARRGIRYMPTMWPGFSWHNLKRGIKHSHVNEIPRLGGRFLWAQAYAYAASSKIRTVWMAQFDEVDEGTAIFKVAANRGEAPREGKWLTLDADGWRLPSDWYLRLCGEAQRMMEGKRRLTHRLPIAPPRLW